MKTILADFFSSNEFWQKFEVVRENKTENSYSINYAYNDLSHNIQLRFLEFEGVKSVWIISSGRTAVDTIYFLNINELDLILNRVGVIRAANSLCIGSLSITALSLSLNNKSQIQHPSS
jgi:hypothetical protein